LDAKRTLVSVSTVPLITFCLAFLLLGLLRETVVKQIPDECDKALFIWSLVMLGTMDRKTAKGEFLRHMELTETGENFTKRDD